MTSHVKHSQSTQRGHAPCHLAVVLLGTGMPDMSGYEVVHRLRKMEGPGRATIVAVSGWGAEADLARLNQFLSSLP